MCSSDNLLNGITLARVTNARTDTSHGPRSETGFPEHHWRSGLGSRMHPSFSRITHTLEFLTTYGRGPTACPAQKRTPTETMPLIPGARTARLSGLTR